MLHVVNMWHGRLALTGEAKRSGGARVGRRTDQGQGGTERPSRIGYAHFGPYAHLPPPAALPLIIHPTTCPSHPSLFSFCIDERLVDWEWLLGVPDGGPGPTEEGCLLAGAGSAADALNVSFNTGL